MKNPSIYIDSTKLLDDLQKLISINSVNPDLDKDGPGEREIAIFIKDLLSDTGFEVKLQDLGCQRMNLTALLRGTGGGRILMLNGHMDTVDTRSMTIDPFDPVLRDGKVYGRGSLDMKAGIAAILSASRAVANSGIKLKGDILLTFVADEEYRSIGTEAVAETWHADGAIICEPTDMKLVLAHKGFTWQRIVFHGKAAHGSRPDEGVDAISHAGIFLAALDNFQREVLKKRSHPLLGSPSVHASLIDGGIGISTYPDSCIMEFERRTIPGETPETVRQEIESILLELGRKYPDFMVDHEQYFVRNPLETDKGNRLVKCLGRSWENIMGFPAEVGGFSGWADSAILNDKGIPSVNFGPAGKGLHAAEEYVEFQSVIDCTKVLTDTIITFCS